MSDEECRKLMDTPVFGFTETGRRAAVWLKTSTGRGKPHKLDAQIDTQAFKNRALTELGEARQEEIAAVTERARRDKSNINREVESLKNELRQIENALSRTGSIKDRVEAEKRKATANKDLKSREQSLFMDGLRIDANAEVAIQTLTNEASLAVTVTRLFVIDVIGGTGNG